MRTQLTLHREQAWFVLAHQGITTAEIARMAGTSVQYVRRLIARMRANIHSLPECAPEGSDAIPTLELWSSPTPRTCRHPSPRRIPGRAVCYCLECDRVSLDGDRWLEQTETPSIAVLAPCGRGHRVRRLTAGSRTEPGGPTSHAPDPRGLKGGTG